MRGSPGPGHDSCAGKWAGHYAALAWLSCSISSFVTHPSARTVASAMFVRTPVGSWASATAARHRMRPNILSRRQTQLSGAVMRS